MPTPTSRRNNAPVSPPRQPSLVPEPLICIAIALGVMGAIFVAFSFLSVFAEGETGEALARYFGGSLIFSGLLLFLLGVGLLGDSRWSGGYYRAPAVIGMVIGAASAALFVAGAGEFVMAPFALAIFAVRPVRRLLGGKGGKR